MDLSLETFFNTFYVEMSYLHLFVFINVLCFIIPCFNQLFLLTKQILTPIVVDKKVSLEL